MDWNEIKTEYLTTETSYRKLADKYGVNRGKIQKRATQEDWPGLKCQYEEEAVSRAVSKVSAGYAKNALRLQNAALSLLEKIELTIDGIDGLKSARAVKDCSDALKNCREIMGIKSEADLEEQKARIAKLRKETEPVEEKDRKLEIVGIPEEYKR